MPEGRRSVFLEEKMSYPGKAVTGHERQCQQPPEAGDNRSDHQSYDAKRADDMQSPGYAPTVFAEIIGVKRTEIGEFSLTHESLRLVGYAREL